MTLEDHPALLRRFSRFRRCDISDFTYLLTYLNKQNNIGHFPQFGIGACTRARKALFYLYESDIQCDLPDIISCCWFVKKMQNSLSRGINVDSRWSQQLSCLGWIGWPIVRPCYLSVYVIKGGVTLWQCWEVWSSRSCHVVMVTSARGISAHTDQIPTVFHSLQPCRRSSPPPLPLSRPRRMIKFA